MKPSQDCIDLIKHFEGYHTALPNGDCKTYLDPGSVDGRPYTIGWGTTRYRTSGVAKYGRNAVGLKDTLTAAEAEQELHAAIAVTAGQVSRMTTNLTQSQFDAAVSFFYNTGPGNKQADRLKANDLEGFIRHLPLYNKGGDGKVLAGLVRRRQAEIELWNKDKQPMQPKVTWIALTKRGNANVLRGMTGPLQMAEHTWTTKAELIALLQRYVDAGTAQVTVADWTPEATSPAPQPQPTPSGTAKLIKTTTRLPGGNYQLLLRIGDKSFACISGQGYAQEFRKPSDPRSTPGSMQPLPQGRYRIGPVVWKGKPYDWSQSFGPGLGPVWFDIDATFSDDRSAFGGHVDTGPVGSAGCVVFTQAVMAEVLKVISAVKFLDVDWGL